MFLDSFPELGAVFLAQKHDGLPGASPQVVCLFHTLNKQIMEMLAIIVKLHQLLGRILGEVYRETPWKTAMFLYHAIELLCWCSISICIWGVRRLSTRVEVVEEAQRIMPLQRNVFVREPCVLWTDIRVYETAREEGM